MEGVKIQIGKKEFVVPEASLEVAEKVLDKTLALSEAKNNAEVFASVAEVVRLCLAENYSDLSLQDVKRALPLRGCLETMGRVMVAAGFEQKTASAPGEAERP